MKLLLDTHVLLWAASEPDKLPDDARSLLEDPHNQPHFSPVNLWEVAIKSGLGRDDFQVDPALMRRGLTDNGYLELPVTGQHAVRIATLPPIHRDPFDRMLVAQALVEGITLLTTDAVVARYPGPIRHV